MNDKPEKQIITDPRLWICDSCQEMGEDANEAGCDRPEHCWATIQAKIIMADRLKKNE